MPAQPGSVEMGSEASPALPQQTKAPCSHRVPRGAGAAQPSPAQPGSSQEDWGTIASPDASVAPGALGAWEEDTGPVHGTAANQQLPWGITGGQPPSPGSPFCPLNPLLPLVCLSEWQTLLVPRQRGWPNTNFSCKDKQLLQEQLAGPRSIKSTVLQLGATVPKELSTSWHLSTLPHTTVPPALSHHSHTNTPDAVKAASLPPTLHN